VISTLFYSLTSRAAAAAAEPEEGRDDHRGDGCRWPMSVGMEIKPRTVKLVSHPRDRFPKGGFERARAKVGRPVISNILPDEPVMEGR